jgi:hypothetical protein
LFATFVSRQDTLHIHRNYFLAKIYAPDLIMTIQKLPADISTDVTTLLLESGGSKYDAHGCNVFLGSKFTSSPQLLSRQVSITLQYADSNNKT